MSRFRAVPVADLGEVPPRFAGFEWLIVDMEPAPDPSAPKPAEGFVTCMIIAGCVAKPPAAMLAHAASFVDGLARGVVANEAPPPSLLN